MEGTPPLCAIPLGCEGWFSWQDCSGDTAAVAMLCSGCIAAAALSSGAGQGQGIPRGVGTAGFYVRDMPAIPKNIPSLPAQQGEPAGAGVGGVRHPRLFQNTMPDGCPKRCSHPG